MPGKGQPYKKKAPKKPMTKKPMPKKNITDDIAKLISPTDKRFLNIQSIATKNIQAAYEKAGSKFTTKGS